MTRLHVALLLVLIIASLLILASTEGERCTGKIRPNYMGGECLK